MAVCCAPSYCLKEGISDEYVSAIVYYLVSDFYLRKGSRTCATSPSGSLKIMLAKPSTVRSFIVCSVSAIVALALHVGMAYIHEPNARGDLRLGIFVKSKYVI